MSTELQQKISALKIIENGLDRLRSGKGHGPADEGYDFLGSVLALILLGVSAGVVLNFPMPETFLALVGRILILIGPVIGPLMIYRQIVKATASTTAASARSVSRTLPNDSTSCRKARASGLFREDLMAA